MIELTASEVMLAAQIGARRHISGKMNNRGDPIGLSNGWENNIEGACAEVAFAKHMNMYLDPNLGKFGEADVGDWHVRSTKYQNGDLCIHPNELSGKYVLLVGQLNQWEVKGWITAEEARQERFYTTKRKDRPVKCYWIPQNELKTVERK
jgi:hypothetical protein